MIVGIPRMFSNFGPGVMRTNSVAVDPGINACPPYARTVLAGNPGGKICAVVCAVVIVYSARMMAPAELRITVGAPVLGITSWFANLGIVVGSSGTWSTEGVPTACSLWLTSSALSEQPTSGSHAMAIPARVVLDRNTADLVNIILILLCSG